MNIRFADRMEEVKPSAIREISRLIQQTPGTISFAGGWPAPELFPTEEMKAVCVNIIDEDGREALQYTSTEGYLPLREFIAKRMGASGVDIDPKDILITNGSQQGLDFSGKLFVNEGDVVICESPSYVGALSAFRAYLPRFVEVPMDEDGMIIEELEKALAQNPGAKFIYTIPDFQNPTGRTLSLERRKRLVELAVKYGVPVIEDNPYGELRFEGERLPAVKHFDTEGIVIYLGTTSKTFCPGLRVGWVAASSDIIRKYVLIKQGADLQANTLSQRQIAKFAEMYDYDAHVRGIIDVYRKRRDLMMDMIRKEFPLNISYTYPKGGLFTWVDLPEGMDAAEVLKKALEQGVAFVPGEAFYPNGGNANHFRLNYCTSSDEKIVEGIKRLGRVLKGL
ncbi:MAG: Aspartate aminotransferase (AspB-4) [Firmicutes bacterium]|nr:Aspartate aminotransferase (AspB-4) [Bacillota bacterium]MDI6705955.1 PLP-dependent aminotransferase family protein [Bacillota bacterium]